MDNGTGITPVMPIGGTGYGDWGGGNAFIWIFGLLILMGMFNGGGMWGNNGFANAIGYENLATSNEVQRGFDNQNSMANEREILCSNDFTSTGGSALYGAIEYGVIVGYPAPSVVFSHTSGAVSSSNKMELFGAI